MQKKSHPKFLVVCLNPTIQKTLVFKHLTVDAVNRAETVRTDASGKGVNVARVLTQCGFKATHLTHAGGANRDWFLSLCRADGIDVAWVDSQSEVRFCTTVIDRDGRTVTELVEEALPVSPDTERRLFATYEKLIGGFDVFVFSGTKAAGYSDSLVPRMVELAARREKLIVLDIKGKDLAASLPYRPAVVKPNLEELLASFKADGPAPGRTEESTDERALRDKVAEIARAWKTKYDAELVVTRGSESVWFNEGGEAAEMTTIPVHALNPIGSGDSFTAGMSIALAEGKSLRAAIQEGNRLGSINASLLKPGSILA